MSTSATEPRSLFLNEVGMLACGKLVLQFSLTYYIVTVPPPECNTVRVVCMLPSFLLGGPTWQTVHQLILDFVAAVAAAAAAALLFSTHFLPPTVAFLSLFVADQPTQPGKRVHRLQHASQRP